MIMSIRHLTFIVHDIEKATRFFQKIFAAEVVYDSGEHTFSLSKERYLLIGDLWVVVMQGMPLAEKTYNHIAFQIPERDFNGYKERIKNLGLEVRTPRNRIEGEGRSIYFYDYDNHLFELHTGTLSERLMAYNAQSI